ncbi:PQQ-dependent sugar dehydrogenase [Methylonatrum kenyense]|uniref:PQQ-dependent sugar dehydrogenase n=1 Tax=Methylonatrum kenyense TaxID=455253 RepID=UPI0020C165A2|nr:PQQ-dependent sugar dehydrogenase [Methylonatrum kenyense]MCK8516019.1 PQQ-dependent sugar dehydrogenase [Methylonatrum kenyense]
MTLLRNLAGSLACCLAVFLLAGGVAAETQGSEYEVETLADGLEHPWALAFLPDGRMLVTERAGRLRLVDEDGLHPDPIAGLPDVHVHSQAGLFHVLPDREAANVLYLTLVEGDRRENTLTLVRGRLEEHALEDLEVLFRAAPWRDTSVHYGGRMLWLDDGSLLLTTGDGFDYRYRAQQPEDHFGSVLRMDADGKAMLDNPFAALEDARQPETWTIGHRNVQGVALDPDTGEIWVSEHGPRGGDRLHRLQAGANYGWPITAHARDYSGAQITPYRSYPGMQDPLYVWDSAIAPGGLAVYRGETFPQWNGDLLVPGLVSRAVHRLRVDGDRVSEEERLFTSLDRRIRAIEVGPDGVLYLLTDHSNGELLRIVPSS